MENPKKINVKQRLITGFSILTAIFIGFGLYTIYSINIVSGLTQTIHDHPLVVSNAALQSNVAITKMHRHMKDVVLVTSPAEINHYIEMVNELESQVYKNLDVIRQRIIGDEGKMLETEARKLFDLWQPIREEVLAFARRGEKKPAADITIGKGAEHVALLETKMRGLTDYARKKAAGFINENKRMRTHLNTTLGFFLMIGIIAFSLVAFFTVNHITSAEKELLESRSLLDKSQSLARIGSWKLDQENRRLTWSDEVFRMFGVPPRETEPTYENFLSVVHPDDRTILDNAYTKSVSEGRDTYEIEHRIIRQDNGEVRIVYERCEHEKDALGKILSSVGMVQDITERKKTEDNLRKSEQKFRDVLDATPFPIAIVDLKDDNIFYWSRSAYDLFGHTAPTASEWYEIAYPDPDYRREVTERWKPFLETARKTGQAVNTGEYRVTCSDGSFRICELHAAFLTDSLIVTFNDITDRKQAEERLQESEEKYRSILDNSPVVIFIKDKDGKYQYINKSFERIHGITDEKIHGLTDFDIFDRELAERFRANDLEILKSKKPMNMEEMVPQEDGIHTVISTKFPLRDSANKAYAICGIATDITDRKKAEEEIRTLNRELEMRVRQRTAQLEKTGKELEDFVYSVSHDLRAPLRSISGFAEIIDRRYKASLNDEGRHYFDNIIQASRQMDILINDLLKFSRLGRKAIKSENVPLEDILKSAVDTLSDQIKKAGACVNLPENLPVIAGDATLATHIFINLLENAVKYHKPDTPPIIDVRSDVEDDTIVITVADNGIGIARQYHEKIFSIFQRLHSQAEYPGTGIGLAAVKKSLQIMGGEISVESEPDKGSIFTVKIPKETLNLEPI